MPDELEQAISSRHDPHVTQNGLGTPIKSGVVFHTRKFTQIFQ